MNATQAIAAYEKNGELGADLRATIASPSERHQICKLLEGKALPPFHALILAMFEQEMIYRKALERREVEAADEDSVSGIYRCAFFLYEIGDPDDIFVLWRAKLLDFDAYCLLGAQYLVGPGVSESIAFLEHSNQPESGKILEYIKNSFDDPDALEEQKRWEQARRANPDNVWL